MWHGGRITTGAYAELKQKRPRDMVLTFECINGIKRGL